MRSNHVKRRLLAGGRAFGTVAFEFATEGLARLTASAGADFLVLDQEHSGFSSERLRTSLLGARTVPDLVPIVRVPSASDSHALAVALDLGALGVMVPMVQSPEDAEAVVRAVRYPPAGDRGFGVLFDDEHGGDVVSYLEYANDEILVIVQVETTRGLDAAEEIAAVEGVDVLWPGHFDLSVSLGIPAQFDHPRFVAALDRVVAACEGHGKTAAMLAATVEQGHRLQDAGFRCLGFSHDVELYRDALRAGLTQLRG
jgi:2-keto-3-deoxy-L-rhamnonate aldolase RhmA